MSGTKDYEVGPIRFAFTPQGGQFEGRLRTAAPELEPYTADVKLTNAPSRSRYAKEAAELCGMDQEELKRALNAVCTRREEEVAAAERAEREHAGEAEGYPDVDEDEIEALVGRRGVLGRFVADAARVHGVVGEVAPLRLLSLNAFGSQLAPASNGKPLGANVVLTAQPGRGKNHLCDAVAALLPEGFFLSLESASAKSLYYGAENDPAYLKHRWIYPNEAEAVDQLVEMLRPLISGGKAVHLTVNKDAGGRNVAAELEVEGPVTIAIPTVRNKLDAQLQSRLLIAELEDYAGRVAAHSRKVSEYLLPGHAAEDFSPLLRAWKAALGSLTGIRRVVFPLDHEGFRFDRDDLPHGARLWANVLGLMCANAWLEQRNREVVELPGSERAVVATPTDYAVAYGVFRASCERSVVNISDSHRRILDAVYQLQQEDKGKQFIGNGSWSQREIWRRTGVPQSTISGQKTYLVKSLKLLVEEHDGKLKLVDQANPSWWAKDDALDGLPKPKQVRTWWNSGDGTPAPEPPGHPGRPRAGGGDGPGDGANGDRDPAVRGPEVPGRPADGVARRGDRTRVADDPDVPGWVKALKRWEDAH